MHFPVAIFLFFSLIYHLYIFKNIFFKQQCSIKFFLFSAHKALSLDDLLW